MNSSLNIVIYEDNLFFQSLVTSLEGEIFRSFFISFDLFFIGLSSLLLIFSFFVTLSFVF